MDPKHRLEQQQHADLETEQLAQSTPTGKAFETVDDLLRHDAAETHPPPQLEERLAKSVENLPAKPTAWWQRWFGKSQP